MNTVFTKYPVQIFLVGGTGSGKTWTVSQSLLPVMVHDNPDLVIYNVSSIFKKEDMENFKKYKHRFWDLPREKLSFSDGDWENITTIMKSKPKQPKLFIFDDLAAVNYKKENFSMVCTVLARQTNSSIIFVSQNMPYGIKGQEMINNVTHVMYAKDTIIPPAPMGQIFSDLITRSRVLKFYTIMKDVIGKIMKENKEKLPHYCICLAVEGTLQSNPNKITVFGPGVLFKINPAIFQDVVYKGQTYEEQM